MENSLMICNCITLVAVGLQNTHASTVHALASGADNNGIEPELE